MGDSADEYELKPVIMADERTKPIVSTSWFPQPAALRVITPEPKRSRSHLWILLALTIIAGALRFTSLDQPAIWGDEAATNARVSGSYADLMSLLADRSVFTPLHYETLWWIKQGMPYWGYATEKDFVPTKRLIDNGVVLTPVMLRLIPAICGTLMIPAIYLLARQLFGKRVSLLAAFLCCFSAYLLVYSRDAKMYSPLWLFCTLNVICLLWWIRSRKMTAWLLWILTGVIMIGIHAVGSAIIGVEALIALTAPRQYRFRWLTVLMSPRGQHPWRRFRLPLMLAFAIGAAAIVWPTVYYYQNFNAQIEKVVNEGERADTGRAGIEWVEKYNNGRSLGDLALFTSSAYLTGWEWPRKFPDLKIDDQARINPLVLKLLQGSTIALLVLLAIGVIPWRTLFNPRTTAIRDFQDQRHVWRAFTKRRMLWLSVWLCVAPYAIYAAAEDRPAFVLDGVASVALQSAPTINWPRLPLKPAEQDLYSFISDKTLWQDIANQWSYSWNLYIESFYSKNIATQRLVSIAVPLAIIGLWFCIRWRWVWKQFASTLLAVIAVIVLTTIIAMLPQTAKSSVWMPRYVGVVFPAFAMVAALLISRQPARWMQIATVSLFVAVNMAQFGGRVFFHSEPPADRIAKDIADSQSPTVMPQHVGPPKFRAYTQLNTVNGPEPGRGTLFGQAGSYYLQLYTGVNSTPQQLKNGQVHTLVNYWSNQVDVVRDISSTPSIERFVVWSVCPTDDMIAADNVIEPLRYKFRRVSEEYIPAFDHWTWRKTFTLVRREYAMK